MDRILQVPFFCQLRKTIAVIIHVIPFPGLFGAPGSPPVMRDDAIATLPKEQHLPVPVVRGQRPTVRENDRLTRSPILVINLRAVFRCNGGHFSSSPLLISCEHHTASPATSPTGAGPPQFLSSGRQATELASAATL